MYTLNTKRASILIVESNHFDILVLKVLLEKYFKLYIVTTSEDAIKAVNELDFDIVLSDTHLGKSDIDGIELMKKIKGNKKTAHLKVFAISTFSENKEILIQQGFSDVLTKPLIKEEIIDILNSLTKQYKFQNN